MTEVPAWSPYVAVAAMVVSFRGDRVVVQGRLRQRSFETRDGDKRTVVELDVDEIGPSLRYATVKVSKAHRAGAESSGADSPGGESNEQPPF